MESTLPLLEKPDLQLDPKNQSDQTIPKSKKVFKWVRRFVYLLIWVFILLNIFNPNFLDYIYSSYLPIGVSNFLSANSIYVSISSLILLLVFVKIRRLIYWFFGFIFLPFYLILIFIPTTTIRSTLLISKFVLGFYSGIKTFRFKMASLLFAILALVVIFKNPNPILVKIAVVIIILRLLGHFIRRFKAISRPVTVINATQNFMFKAWEKMKVDTYMKSISEWKEMDPKEEKYNQKKMEILSGLWLVNRIFIRLAKFLKKAESTKVVATYFITSVVYTSIVTTISFALAYYGLYKVDPTSFTGITSGNFFNFLYFSFSTLTNSNFGDITPVSSSMKLLFSLEVATSITILVILFFVFTTVIMERYKRNLDEFIENLMKEGSAVGGMMASEFNKGLKEIAEEIIRHSKGNDNKFFRIDEDELLDN